MPHRLRVRALAGSASVRFRTDRMATLWYFPPMLRDFVIENRIELIRRCREKVSKRIVPNDLPFVADHGVPLFLQQLVDTLQLEHTPRSREHAEGGATPAPTTIGRAAALHGAELLALGYSVDQVVHGYGDVCQSITALAVERNYAISTNDFRTLNRCLDNAIADAVTSYGAARQVSADKQAVTQQHQLLVYANEQRRLVDIALQALSAIRTGNVGLSGATGTLLQFALSELGALADQILPDLQVSHAGPEAARH